MAIIRCVFWQRDVFFQRFAKLFFQGTHRNHPSVFKVPVWKKLRCEGWSPRPRWRAAESDDIVVPGARKSKLAGPGSGRGNVGVQQHSNTSSWVVVSKSS